jgi:hypothetical protein
MGSILQRTLIFVGLLVAGLVVYSSWYGIKADRFDETVVPYLESALPKLTSWQYAQLKPLLSPQAQIEFDSDEGQAVYKLFSKLGQLESIGTPEYLGDRSETSEALGDIEVVACQVPLQFETGPGVIKKNLASDGERYYIHHFGIHSEIFAAKTTSD